MPWVFTTLGENACSENPKVQYLLAFTFPLQMPEVLGWPAASLKSCRMLLLPLSMTVTAGFAIAASVGASAT